jgi:hypothetical protein
MGLDGRGVTSMTQHMAEPGPGVKGWDTSLVIDCTPAQHAHLQELITESLSSDWRGPRPELGQGIALQGLPSWDFGVYQSERCNKLMERACVVGGLASCEAQRKASPSVRHQLLDGRWHHETERPVSGDLLHWRQNGLEARSEEGQKVPLQPRERGRFQLQVGSGRSKARGCRSSGSRHWSKQARSTWYSAWRSN